MRSDEYIRAISRSSGLSQYELSKRMGRSKSYVSVYLANGISPRIGLAAEIADAAGCDLLVRNRETGEEEIVEPPER